MKTKIEFIKRVYENHFSDERTLAVYVYCECENSLELIKDFIEDNSFFEFVRCGNEIIDGLYCDWFSVDYHHGEMTKIRNDIKSVFNKARKVVC